MARSDEICAAVIDKLDVMEIAFELTVEKVLPALKDTLRELKISDAENITANSQEELYIELRTEYWMLHRLKNNQTLNFRYTTGVDGRSVDKSMIPKMIKDTMSDIDKEFKIYKSKRANGTGAIAQFTTRTPSRLEE